MIRGEIWVKLVLVFFGLLNKGLESNCVLRFTHEYDHRDSVMPI